MVPDDNPFHAHSSLLGFVGAVVAVATIGSLTHWGRAWLMLYIACGLAALWFFVRSLARAR